MDQVTKASIADLLINISAGWFIASLGVPFLTGYALIIKVGLLLGDLIGGILCLSLAITLRKGFKK